jgi:DNA-binding SARP family transcriptional activator
MSRTTAVWGDMPELLEIRVLGPLRVRTASGVLVEPRAWRTAKTRDLLRLLAVAGGETVSVDHVLEALWPDAPPERGRASLRTAASHIRHLLGEAHVVRQPAGLSLVGAWVDAQAFESLATTAMHLIGVGDTANGVTTAWEAANLYGGDLCEDEPSGEWAGPLRERYRSRLRTLLLDAAEAANEVGWLRDALELGTRALALDPCSERAYRVLMLTHDGLGATEQALGLFERCRHVLADELGADPGPETRAVHLELLRPREPARAPAPPFTGRQGPLKRVTAAMPAVVEEGQPSGFVVTGPAGSGRTRFVRQVTEHWTHRVVEVRCGPAAATGGGDLLHLVARAAGHRTPLGSPVAALDAALAAGPLLLVLDDVHLADDASLALLTNALQQHRPLLMLATALDDGDALPAALDVHPDLWAQVALPPMSHEEVALLLESVLGGPPSTALVDELSAASAGIPAALVAASWQLLRHGEIMATPDGMVRVSRRLGSLPAQAESRLAVARQQAGAAGEAALDLLAVLDRWTTTAELAHLTGLPADELRPALDLLGDLGVVAQQARGYRLRGPLVREAAYRWLRPSVRRALHLAVAGRAQLPAAERITHWLHSGEPALACAAALEAADEALARGDDVHVHAHLLSVRSFAEEHGVEAKDKIVLTERLAEASERLGRTLEARALLEEATGLARASAPEALARLYQRLGRLASTHGDALRAYERAGRAPTNDRDERRIALSVAAATVGSMPDVAAGLLQRAVQDADASDDIEAQIEARVLLCRAAGQRRDLVVAYEAGKAALALAEPTGSASLFARAAHALVQTPAFLGGGLRELALVKRAYERSVTAGDLAAVSDVGLTYCLVLHDLGSADFDRTWDTVSRLGQRSGRARLRLLLDVLFCLERDQLSRAGRLLAELPDRLEAVVADQAVHLLAARLAEARGDVEGAVAGLSAIVHRDHGGSPLLLVPEAAARLAAVLAPTEPGRAQEQLDLALRTAGARLYPREQVCVLRARAALLAAEGRQESAATLALAAAIAARRSGLVFQEAAALRYREHLLHAAARPDGSPTPVPAQRLRHLPRPQRSQGLFLTRAPSEQVSTQREEGAG